MPDDSAAPLVTDPFARFRAWLAEAERTSPIPTR